MTGHNNLMVPFTQLGYHDKHRTKFSCTGCHSATPIGLKKPTSGLCNDCHSMESESSAEVHKKHIPDGYACTTCHVMP